MQKLTIELPSTMILHIEAGELECIESDGTFYVPMIKGAKVSATANQGSSAPVAATTTKVVPAKADVVDDTIKAAPAKSAKAATSKATKSNDPEPIEDWSTLVVGQNILVELDIPDYVGKLWSAEVEKVDEDEVTVKFHEDGTSDKLMPSDKVFKFSVK